MEPIFWQVLCLNHNHIECVVPRPKQNIPPVRTRYPGGPPPINPPQQPVNNYTPDAYTPLLENLEVLHLGYAKPVCVCVCVREKSLEHNVIHTFRHTVFIHLAVHCTLTVPGNAT